jgi:hypothetical protein
MSGAAASQCDPSLPEETSSAFALPSTVPEGGFRALGTGTGVPPESGASSHGKNICARGAVCLSQLKQSGIGLEELCQLGLPTTDSGLQCMDGTQRQALELLLCCDPKVLVPLLVLHVIMFSVHWP